MMMLPPHAFYYKLADKMEDGIYQWTSATYTDTFPFVVSARLRGSDAGYVFAATHPSKLQGFLDRFNEGKRSVCLSVRDLVRGVHFQVSRLEQEVELEEVTKPPTQEETTTWENRLKFTKYLMVEKGLFDEWMGEPVPSTPPP